MGYKERSSSRREKPLQSGLEIEGVEECLYSLSQVAAEGQEHTHPFDGSSDTESAPLTGQAPHRQKDYLAACRLLKQRNLVRIIYFQSDINYTF